MDADVKYRLIYTAIGSFVFFELLLSALIGHKSGWININLLAYPYWLGLPAAYPIMIAPGLCRFLKAGDRSKYWALLVFIPLLSPLIILVLLALKKSGPREPSAESILERLEF